MMLGRIPLTPTSYLRRAGTVFAGRTAVVDGGFSLTYEQLGERVARAAGMLRARGLAAGDRVAVLARNSPLMLEAHLSVPTLGGVLVPLNHRLTPADLGRIVEHAGATLILHDDDFADVAAGMGPAALGAERWALELQEAAPLDPDPPDEETLLSINYTSGTTGDPKGVMYAHRGAYLQALAMAYHSQLGPGSVYLWTLPMFHCHGWSFPWAVTAAGATHVCLDRPDPELVWDAIHRHRVTHLSAAPTVLRGLADHPGAEPVPGAPLKVGTGGAPPSPALLARLSELNVEVTHLYGLTETYGPAVVCDWQPEWDAQPHAEQARLKSRQGNANILAGELRVADEAGAEVPADGETLGEVVLRGNNVMLGYYRDPAATEEATLGDGWLRTGDLAVLHPDGYVELRDRAKDIVISGGENVPSIEVEHAVGGHPAVAEVAVVGRPDERWGEVPVAFVTLHAGAQATADELVAYARQTLPGFKAPREIVFDALPKTATGKIQKNLLRERVRAQQRA